jgi:UDP-N-acetyl-D-galactosamine dehydrogenase
VAELQSFGCSVAVHDPIAEAPEAVHEYGISLTAWVDLPDDADAIVAAVSHKEYLAMPLAELTGKLKPQGVFVDVKSAYDARAIAQSGYTMWRL